jgi:hypothetical protein
MWVQVALLAARAADAAARFTTSDPEHGESDASFWARALARQCAGQRDELIYLAPWLALPVARATDNDLPGANGVPTLRELAALASAWSPIVDHGRNKAPTSEY